ncbi:preprotein translocase subunit SecG [Prosthecobacter dejongeii]|uniref:Protein-export membrane protein SecG n=1 Tax=Prosthecobacter dejongeii TaxID=48465 RepID=A0A7W7YLS4_9BACT|nr:preprotein translocase subunit SecG [Prosthecobacter dejongeii]MBB5038377.1 preprotein translocase subunit SecG [Prosthecobacter dejongeii]
MVDILIGTLTVVEVLVCFLLILIVLMQRPKQEGLGASFGDGMMSQIAGAQTTNVLQKFTVYLAVALFVLTLSLALLVTRKQSQKANARIFDAPPPAAAPAEAPKVEVTPAAPGAPAATTPATPAPATPAAEAPKPATPAPAAEAPKAPEPAKPAMKEPGEAAAPAPAAATTPAVEAPKPAAPAAPAPAAPAPAAPSAPATPAPAAPNP